MRGDCSFDMGGIELLTIILFIIKQIHWIWVSEWVTDYCLTPIQQLFSYIMERTVNFQWDDDEVHFVLDQYAELDLYSASSQK
jgi:hypothetical protein